MRSSEPRFGIGTLGRAFEMPMLFIGIAIGASRPSSAVALLWRMDGRRR
jgi:hypothetical protein